MGLNSSRNLELPATAVCYIGSSQVINKRIDGISLRDRYHQLFQSNSKMRSSYGVFARCDLTVGTIITGVCESAYSWKRCDECPHDGAIWVTLMNDADMELLSSPRRELNSSPSKGPPWWSYDQLSATLRQYQTTDRCNTVLQGSNLIVRRPIRAGEELTRRYTLEKWQGWLLMEITDPNFRLRQLPTPGTNEERKTAFENLRRALLNHNYLLGYINGRDYEGEPLTFKYTPPARFLGPEMWAEKV